MTIAILKSLGMFIFLWKFFLCNFVFTNFFFQSFGRSWFSCRYCASASQVRNFSSENRPTSFFSVSDHKFHIPERAQNSSKDVCCPGILCAGQKCDSVPTWKGTLKVLGDVHNAEFVVTFWILLFRTINRRQKFLTEEEHFVLLQKRVVITKQENCRPRYGISSASHNQLSIYLQWKCLGGLHIGKSHVGFSLADWLPKHFDSHIGSYTFLLQLRSIYFSVFNDRIL